jgi:hypothetical protein
MMTPILTMGSTVNCGHAGTTTLAPSQQKVVIGGEPIAVQPDQHIVSGCSLASSSATFCTVLTWSAPAQNVVIDGQPALLQTSIPTGVGPGIVVNAQTEVVGS